MRLFLSICFFALFRVAHVISDENLFSDGPYQLLDEWTTTPALGTGPEPSLWNLDDGQLTQATTFDLTSLPISDDSNLDLWASCPLNGLGKRDDPHPSCNVAPLRKEDVPKLPTYEDVKKAVGDTPPNTELDELLLRANLVDPMYLPDNKCPPTNPWHMCCICDDAFALEVCQDCYLCKSAPFSQFTPLVLELLGELETVSCGLNSGCLDGGLCRKPHIQVCCSVYGRTPVSLTLSNLATQWIVRCRGVQLTLVESGLGELLR